MSKEGSRGEVTGGWNAACESLTTCYIPEQIVLAAAQQLGTSVAGTYSRRDGEDKFRNIAAGAGI